MADTCVAPDGREMIRFGMTPARSIAAVSIVAFTPMLAYLFGPKLVFWIGGIFGRYLKRKTSTRRTQVLEMVAREQKEWEENDGKGRRDSDEWETVDSYAVGTAKNGQKGGDAEWDGIVGFFHPFWYVLLSAGFWLVLTA